MTNVSNRSAVVIPLEFRNSWAEAEHAEWEARPNGGGSDYTIYKERDSDGDFSYDIWFGDDCLGQREVYEDAVAFAQDHHASRVCSMLNLDSLSPTPTKGPELCWIGEGRRYRAETSFGPYVLEYEEAFGHAMGQWRLTGPDGWIYDGFAELEEAKQKALDEFAILLGVAPVPDELLALAKDAWAMAQKAKRKFPQKEGVVPPHDKVAEEVGELFKAILHCSEGRDSLQHVREEMVDTIAMIFRVHQEGVKALGLPPVKEEGGEDE